GSKPVQKRILFAMNELGLRHDKPTRKSATIVGEVMGKYHPHGDSSIYLAIVKMAQEFHLRYPLVIGQGNFGSIDDDPPAAMRYTEAKLSKVGEYLLEDLDKNTVDFKSNFDDTLKEPAILPGKFPNLICNGTSGIAVGLATDVPPHNFREVAGALSALIDNPGITVSGLMEYVKGPDFPTYGILTDASALKDVYETGLGSIELAGKILLEEKGLRKDLIITEIPYRVVKSKLVQEITTLYLNNESKYNLILRGIKEVRDESSKEGIRIVIELFKDASVEAIKTALYNQTSLRVRIKVNMVGLVKNHPRVLPLKDVLNTYLEHRREVIIRRTQFDLDKALKRIHIVEGLLIALDNIDAVIHTIKTSKDTPEAKANLISRFKLSELQADAILDMRLQRLTGLETGKLRDEKAELEKTITSLREILASSKIRDQIIKTELDEMVKEVGDDRRTTFDTIVTEKIGAEELISNDPILLTVSKKGFLIREIGNTIKMSSRGTRGRKGDVTDSNRLESDDFIFATVSGFLKDTILFVTDSGRIYSLKCYEIRGDTEGKITRSHIRNIDRLREIEVRSELITAVLVVHEFTEKHFILFITRKGKAARIGLNHFENINRTGVNSINLKNGDAVAGAVITDGTKKLFLIKKNAKGFRFDENLFSVHNRGVGGEKATSVSSAEEEVLGMELAEENRLIIFITKDGRGRKVKPGEFSELVNRGGKGHKLVLLGKGRSLASFVICEEDDTLIITTKNGRRISMGVDKVGPNLLKLMDIKGDDEVSSISTVKVTE
ncbi:MAG: DNA topoisomerase (ATP-hydrolyzing), partial [Brevinematales bacterium]